MSLAWPLSKDGVAVSLGRVLDHLRDNFEALSGDLDEEDVDSTDAIERTHRCENPDWLRW